VENHGYRLLLLVAFLISTGYAALNIYLTLHIQSLGGSTSVAGVAFAIAALSELPIIGFGAVILRRVGARNVIFIGLVAYVIRFILFGFGASTSFVLVAQAMHGLSFGMFLIASVTLAHRLVGRQHAATAQALLAMVSMGLGSIIGSLTGGIAIDYVSTSTIYRFIALMMATTLAIFFIGTRRLSRDAYDPPTAQA
jgi:PPP family 3-phenylpropionic acid transporter